jgi:hypothetical protein
LKEERRQRVYENIVLRKKKFGPKRGEVTREWRKLLNEELNDLCSPPNIGLIISRMIWEGHITRIGDKRIAYMVFVGRPEGKIPFGRHRRGWENNINLEIE